MSTDTEWLTVVVHYYIMVPTHLLSLLEGFLVVLVKLISNKFDSIIYISFNVNLFYNMWVLFMVHVVSFHVFIHVPFFTFIFNDTYLDLNFNKNLKKFKIIENLTKIEDK